MTPLAAYPIATASTPTTPNDWADVLVVVAVLIAISVLAGLAFFLIRRHALSEHDHTPEPLSLGGLRDLLKRGEITQDEFDKARSAIIATHAPHLADQNADHPPNPPAPPPEPSADPPQPPAPGREAPPDPDRPAD